MEETGILRSLHGKTATVIPRVQHLPQTRLELFRMRSIVEYVHRARHKETKGRVFGRGPARTPFFIYLFYLRQINQVAPPLCVKLLHFENNVMNLDLVYFPPLLLVKASLFYGVFLRCMINCLMLLFTFSGFVYGAKDKKKLKVFIDDVNLPVPDDYDVQRCNEVSMLISKFG